LTISDFCSINKLSSAKSKMSISACPSSAIEVSFNKRRPCLILGEDTDTTFYPIVTQKLLSETEKIIKDRMWLVEGPNFKGYWVVFDNTYVEIGDIVRILNILRNQKVIDKERSIRITHPSSYPGKNNFYVMSRSQSSVK